MTLTQPRRCATELAACLALTARSYAGLAVGTCPNPKPLHCASYTLSGCIWHNPDAIGCLQSAFLPVIQSPTLLSRPAPPAHAASAHAWLWSSLSTQFGPPHGVGVSICALLPTWMRSCASHSSKLLPNLSCIRQMVCGKSGGQEGRVKAVTSRRRGVSRTPARHGYRSHRSPTCAILFSSCMFSGSWFTILTGGVGCCCFAGACGLAYEQLV